MYRQLPRRDSHPLAFETMESPFSVFLDQFIRILLRVALPGTFRIWFVFSSVVTAFRDAADRLSRGEYRACFPEGTFPPGLPYVPTVADLLSGG